MPDKFRYVGEQDFYHAAQGQLDEGDVVELSDVAAEEFGHLFTEVAESPDDSTEQESESSAPEATSRPFDPREYSVADLRDRLDDESLSADDLDALEALENERDNGPRSTALRAIESARD